MNKLLISVISLVLFNASIFGDEVESVNVPANIKKTFNTFLPDAQPDNCKWFLENDGKEYQAECTLGENEENSTLVNFVIGKKGDKPKMNYLISREQFTKYNIPEKAIKKAKEVFRKFMETEEEADATGGSVEIGINGKIKGYELTAISTNGEVLRAKFNTSGNMIGKVIKEEMKGAR